MQNRKEDFTEFVETIKKKVHDWWVSYNRKLWTRCIFVYGFLLLLVVLVGAVTFAHFNLFHTDVASARYMLSALVQSQAAIVAIVITLTLIAVQLTASAYSPRVIDIFKKNPDMWILLSCYGVSIFYGFIVLKLVEGAEGEAVSQSAIWSLGRFSISFEFCVSLAYWLGAFTFIVLFPYMWNIIGLLKSENVIKRLTNEITKDKILNSKEDPIQPIVDIIHGSIMKYDLETTRVGLKAVTGRVIEIIGSNSEEKISGHFCSHLERVGKLAVSKQDEESVIEVIKNLENFGKSITEKELKDAILQIAVSLEDLGRTAAEKGLANATSQAAASLGEVVIAAVKKKLEDAAVIAAVRLENIGTAAVKKGLEATAVIAAMALRDVGTVATKKGLNATTSVVVGCLRDVVTTAAKKGLKHATQVAAGCLIVIGTVAAKEGLEDETEQAALSLAQLQTISEDIETIQDYESVFGDEDRVSFRKFMEIYEQELEKLRAEK